MNHFGAVGVVGCLIVLAGCNSTESKERPLAEVVVTKVVQKDVPVYANWIGTTEGYNNAAIRPQVKGYLNKIVYAQGTAVESGTLMFLIDSRAFEAALKSAMGQLGEAKANQRKTQSHVQRYRPLAKQGAVSEQELEDAVQNAMAANAAVVAAQAAVDQSQLDLSWTRITSPITGVAGISVAQVGDLVSPETLLTTVSQLDPIKVKFPISQQQYLRLVRSGGGVSAVGDLSDVGAILDLSLADGSKWPERGTPYLVGRSVDEMTGTIIAEGHFPNPNNVLRPGQFAAVRAKMGDHKDALIIPQRAISEVQGTYLVSVVGPNDVVEVRKVEVGETVGDNWIITNGVKAGETVIVEGIQKVKSGVKVKPVSEKQASEAPKKSASNRWNDGHEASSSMSPASSTDAMS